MTGGHNIYITGASCSGVSTLGAALSARFGMQQIDVDDVYWMPTDPPFSVKRPPEDRIKLIAERQRACNGWILTGSPKEQNYECGLSQHAHRLSGIRWISDRNRGEAGTGPCGKGP